ncbi:hypothetical protein GXW77_07980 [Roseomonas alkaliterrae]|nr:hypothetical protein [Neoroseomonas alkaliterrae]MBR0676111.1 hypothetical protein [Neoroseomonas alkaliterrae]
MTMAAEGQRRIRALRPFSYSLDGVRLIAVAAGEKVSLRAGAAAGLVAEGYAEAVAVDPSPRQQPARRRPPVRDPA